MVAIFPPTPDTEEEPCQIRVARGRGQESGLEFAEESLQSTSTIGGRKLLELADSEGEQKIYLPKYIIKTKMYADKQIPVFEIQKSWIDDQFWLRLIGHLISTPMTLGLST